MYNPSQPFEEDQWNMVENHFDIMLKNPKLTFMFINELTTNPKSLDAIIIKLQTIRSTIIRRFEDDLQNEIVRGRIRNVSLISVLLTVLSLNLTLFIIQPIFQKTTNTSDEAIQHHN